MIFSKTRIYDGVFDEDTRSYIQQGDIVIPDIGWITWYLVKLDNACMNHEYRPQLLGDQGDHFII